MRVLIIYYGVEVVVLLCVVVCVYICNLSCAEYVGFLFCLCYMHRRPPVFTPIYSSAASDGYKRQGLRRSSSRMPLHRWDKAVGGTWTVVREGCRTVSHTHLRAHETKANLVCRYLLEKKKRKALSSDTETLS